MKIILTEWYPDWRGSEPQELRPAVLDLAEKANSTYFVVSLGNGNFEEAYIEVETLEALDHVRDLLTEVGKARRLSDPTEAAGRRLYRRGCEVYSQDQDAFIFVNPVPRPELFSAGQF